MKFLLFIVSKRRSEGPKARTKVGPTVVGEAEDSRTPKQIFEATK